MKIIVSICIVLALCLTSCSTKTQPTPTPTVSVFDPAKTPIPTVNGIATDYLGNQYRMVSPEIVNSNGTTTAELWERIQPLETNHWYTPSLGSRFDTNHPPIFTSLMR